MKSAVALLFAALLVTGCAHKEDTSMVGEPRTAFQSIVVNTPGVTGVNCVMQSGSNTYSVMAPGSVMVRRAPDVMNISCFKGNHMRGQTTASPTFAPREGEAVRGTQGTCLTCAYPNMVTVAMSLNSGSMAVPYTILR